MDCRLKLIDLDWTVMEGCRLILLIDIELSVIEAGVKHTVLFHLFLEGTQGKGKGKVYPTTVHEGP